MVIVVVVVGLSHTIHTHKLLHTHTHTRMTSLEESLETEIPSDIDRFGLPRHTLPAQPSPPMSRLSLNGNASILPSSTNINSPAMTHSPHSSKSNDDAIDSQDISTIATMMGGVHSAFQHHQHHHHHHRHHHHSHFNIDELYVKSQPMMQRNMGKRSSPQKHTHTHTHTITLKHTHPFCHTFNVVSPACENTICVCVFCRVFVCRP